MPYEISQNVALAVMAVVPGSIGYRVFCRWRVRRQVPFLASQARLNLATLGNFGRYKRPANWR